MNKKITFLILACIGLLAVSCKKEYAKFPYSDIESFTIKDTTGAPLKAVLENSNIIVYWPPFQTVPDSITPQIIVSDQATVTPASGKKVPFNTSVIYTVTAQDGSTRKYTLKPAVNQPRLTGLTFSLGENVGGSLGISGEYIIADTNVTKLSLINQQNKEVRLWGSTFNEFTITGISIYNTPITLDTGVYKIKFVNGTQTVISNNFHLGPPFLSIGEKAFPYLGKTLKPGDALEFIFQSDDQASKYYINDLASITIGFTNSDIPWTVIPVSTQNASGAKFIIPADCPAGTINYMFLQIKNGNSAGGYTIPEGKEIIITR